MNLTESPSTHQDVKQHYSTHQKLERDGEHGPYMHGTSAGHASTTEPGNSTYTKQMDTANLPKRPFTTNIEKFQKKLQWIQQKYNHETHL